LLANGEITRAIHLEELKYTKAALAKLTAAGGSIAGAPAPDSDAGSGDHD
jgi:ribosomal protein L15